MEGFLTALLIISILLLLLFLNRVRIYLRYARIGRNDELAVKICLLKGIVCWRFKLPFVKIVKKRNRLALKVSALLKEKRGHCLKEEEKELPLPGLRKMMKILPVFRYLLRRTRIKKFSWHTEIGTGDPFYTGIAAGAAWSLKGVLLSAICRLPTYGAGRPEVAVRPNFFNACFNTAFECIFEISTGHIMLTGIKALLISFKRSKKRNGW